jgi:hypothetical protein
MTVDDVQVTVRATEKTYTNIFGETTLTIYKDVGFSNMPEGYDPEDPNTWPVVESGDSYDFGNATGGEGPYTWAVDGPIPIDPFEAESFEFAPETTGAFAGVYTVMVCDSNNWCQSVNVKVPMTFTPSKKAMLGDSSKAYDFVVAGAPEGTDLEVILVTRDEVEIADPGDYGTISPDNPSFGTEATALFAFSPADVTAEYKSFLFRAQVTEVGLDTPLMDNGLDVLYSGVMRIFPIKIFEGTVQDVNGLIVGAEVMVTLGSEPIEGSPFTTGNQGEFSFVAADPSFIEQHYAVAVSKAGYVTQVLTTDGWENPLIITLALADSALSVSGTVMETGGVVPIPGARVESTADSQTVFAFSDANGDYTLNLPLSGTWNYETTNSYVDPNPWGCPPMDPYVGTVTFTQNGNEITMVDDEEGTFTGTFDGTDYNFAGSQREQDGTATLDISFSLSSRTSGSGTIQWSWIDDTGQATCTGGADLTVAKQGGAELYARASKVGFKAAEQDVYLNPDFELDPQTVGPQQEVCDDGGGSFQWESCVVDIPADSLDATPGLDCYDMTVNAAIEVGEESLYTENSVVLFQIDILGVPLPLEPPIRVTMPFDNDDVEPGDFKAGIAVIYHAPTENDLRNGNNVAAVPTADIVSEDHLNALVTFLVRDHLSVFGAGGAQPGGQQVAAGGGGGG